VNPDADANADACALAFSQRIAPCLWRRLDP